MAISVEAIMETARRRRRVFRTSFWFPHTDHRTRKARAGSASPVLGDREADETAHRRIVRRVVVDCVVGNGNEQRRWLVEQVLDRKRELHVRKHAATLARSEEHTSELQSLMRISY